MPSPPFNASAIESCNMMLRKRDYDYCYNIDSMDQFPVRQTLGECISTAGKSILILVKCAQKSQ